MASPISFYFVCFCTVFVPGMGFGCPVFVAGFLGLFWFSSPIWGLVVPSLLRVFCPGLCLTRMVPKILQDLMLQGTVYYTSVGCCWKDAESSYMVLQPPVISRAVSRFALFVLALFSLGSFPSSSLLAIINGSNLLIYIPSSCVGFRFLGITLIGIGVALFILIGITCKVQLGERGITIKGTFCSMPLVLALTALGIFALSVSSQGGGKPVPGTSYKEYHVESYSKWMQHKLIANWDKYYKKAVVENKWYVCRKRAFHKDYSAPEPAFESGCCEPPKDCNFNHTSSHLWAKLESNNNKSNDDCNRWDNDPNTLCFNCQSCKAGFLEEVKSQWFTAGLLLTFFGGCFALIPAILAIHGSVGSSSSSQDYRALA